MTPCLPALNASGNPGRTGEGPLSALRSQCRRGGLCDDCENYIKSDYKTATLEAAASLVHYSPAYLSSAFKTDTGVSFSRYLLQVRMEQAMQMLSDRSVKFYEIADAVGYLNPKISPVISRNITESHHRNSVQGNSRK